MKQRAPVMRVGATVKALYDYAPFATPDTRIHYQKDQIGTVVGMSDAGGIEISFDEGVPTIVTSSGATRKIVFDPRDFIVIG